MVRLAIKQTVTVQLISTMINMIAGYEVLWKPTEGGST